MQNRHPFDNFEEKVKQHVEAWGQQDEQQLEAWEQQVAAWEQEYGLNAQDRLAKAKQELPYGSCSLFYQEHKTRFEMLSALWWSLQGFLGWKSVLEDALTHLLGRPVILSILVRSRVIDLQKQVTHLIAKETNYGEQLELLKLKLNENKLGLKRLLTDLTDIVDNELKVPVDDVSSNRHQEAFQAIQTIYQTFCLTEDLTQLSVIYHDFMERWKIWSSPMHSNAEHHKCSIMHLCRIAQCLQNIQSTHDAVIKQIDQKSLYEALYTDVLKCLYAIVQRVHSIQHMTDIPKNLMNTTLEILSNSLLSQDPQGIESARCLMRELQDNIKVCLPSHSYPRERERDAIILLSALKSAFLKNVPSSLAAVSLASDAAHTASTGPSTFSTSTSLGLFSSSNNNNVFPFTQAQQSQSTVSTIAPKQYK